MHLHKQGLYTTRTAFHCNLFCVIIKHMEDNQCNPAPTSIPRPQSLSVCLHIPINFSCLKQHALIISVFMWVKILGTA